LIAELRRDRGGERTAAAIAAAAACWKSADFEESRAAFLAKRAPRLTGT